MLDWTAGYVADVNYTYGYYTELNPLRARLAFLNAGLVPPANGIHCELGYGQGISTNIHAAASASSWYATDFNPTQASFAQSLARVSKAEAHLTDEAFAEFCVRTDLPDFDSIGLHGIWSWVSDENRAIIVDFIRRKLKIGGVVYISYNTQPGWAAIAPVRDLITEHSEVMSASGQGIVSRIDASLDFVDKLFGTSPAFLKANPLVAERFKAIRTQSRNYLAHEYFNRSWVPMPFSKVLEWLTPAKISFACSANYIENFDSVNLTGEQQELLREIPDAMFRESVRDFMVNQQFRRDYWVRGPRKLSALEQVEAFRGLSVVLVNHRPDVSMKITGGACEATMQPAIYVPILDSLADHKPRTLDQIELAVKKSGVNLAQVIQAIMILASIGHVADVQDDAIVVKARAYTDKLNRYIVEKARNSNDLNYLASPVTGGGIRLSRTEQLFIFALQQGKKQPAELVQFVFEILVRQNHKIVKNGKVLETPEENKAELTTQVQAFVSKQIPILKALQII
jgi:SAM-dependent methyltransferase